MNHTVNDKKIDIAVSTPSCNEVVILRNLGAGKWSIPYRISLPGNATPSLVRLADMNGDGKADLIVNDDEYEYVLIAISKGIPTPASATGISYDLLQTPDLVNLGPGLVTQPDLTDNTTECGTPSVTVGACRPIVGDEIGTSDGTWGGFDDAAAAGYDYSFTYTWERKTASGSWATIPNQTGSSYTLTTGDVNYLVRSCVTAYGGQAGARIPADQPACSGATRATRAS
jgi:hypothetical protein